MPKIITETVKQAEKIDWSRINQISGLGQVADGTTDGAKGPLNQAFVARLGAALQHPALKKLGEEVGLNFDDGLIGLINEPAKPNPFPDGKR